MTTNNKTVQEAFELAKLTDNETNLFKWFS